jgi:hypothetical protein
MQMGLEEIRAFRQQPDQFLGGNFGLTGFDHGLDLGDIIEPLPPASRLHKLPDRSVGQIPTNHR